MSYIPTYVNYYITLLIKDGKGNVVKKVVNQGGESLPWCVETLNLIQAAHTPDGGWMEE